MHYSVLMRDCVSLALVMWGQLHIREEPLKTHMKYPLCTWSSTAMRVVLSTSTIFLIRFTVSTVRYTNMYTYKMQFREHNRYYDMLMMFTSPYQGYAHGCKTTIIYRVRINADTPFLASNYVDR